MFGAAKGMSGFTRGLVVGALLGVYVAQSYDVPNVKEAFEASMEVAKDWERENRKRAARGTSGKDESPSSKASE